MATPDDAHIAKGIDAAQTWLQFARNAGDQGIEEIRSTDRSLARLAAQDAALADSNHPFDVAVAHGQATLNAKYAAACRAVALQGADHLPKTGSRVAARRRRHGAPLQGKPE